MLSLVFSTTLAPMCLHTPDMAASGDPVLYKKAFIKLYEASLCVPQAGYDEDKPFAIHLHYRRDFSGELITKASLIEMSRLSGQDKETFVDLRPLLLECFPDVSKGDSITGVSDGGDKAVFYYNGEKSCDVEWPGFREYFFGIWLSEDSREPEKAKRLKGLVKPTESKAP